MTKNIAWKGYATGNEHNDLRVYTGLDVQYQKCENSDDPEANMLHIFTDKKQYDHKDEVIYRSLSSVPVSVVQAIKLRDILNKYIDGTLTEDDLKEDEG